MRIGWRQTEEAGLKQEREARLPLFECTRRFRSYSSWLMPGLTGRTKPAAAILVGKIDATGEGDTDSD